ncbi:hypothetical protein TZ03_22505 [Pseudomonas sp. 10-1B]|nr:hypothetical protein TZ03_22505 [Pseudomonas sp. 10-1B]
MVDDVMTPSERKEYEEYVLRRPKSCGKQCNLGDFASLFAGKPRPHRVSAYLKACAIIVGAASAANTGAAGARYFMGKSLVYRRRS